MIYKFKNQAIPDDDDWIDADENNTDGDTPDQGDMSIPDLDEPFELPKEVRNDDNKKETSKSGTAN